MKRLELVMEKGYGSIYDFLKENEEAKKIFAKRHNIDIDKLDEMLKEASDEILEYIDSDTDEILSILNEMERDENTVYWAYYDEKYDCITVLEFKIVEMGVAE